MFWALNGTTRSPSRANMRQSAVARSDFPAWEVVPCTMTTLAALTRLRAPRGRRGRSWNGAATVRARSLRRAVRPSPVAQPGCSSEGRRGPPSSSRYASEHRVEVMVADRAGGGRERKQIVHRRRHLEPAPVAVPHHPLDPLRIDRPRAHHPRDLLFEAPHPRALGTGVVVVPDGRRPHPRGGAPRPSPRPRTGSSRRSPGGRARGCPGCAPPPRRGSADARTGRARPHPSAASAP